MIEELLYYLGVMLVVEVVIGLALYGVYLYLRLPRGPDSAPFEKLCVGHRGCRGYKNIPENTIPSFAFAVDNGADAIELDVQLTADGEALVVHDDLTDRLFTTKGRFITQMTFAETQQLVFEGTTDTSLRPPSLTTVLQYIKDESARTGRPLKVFVELKGLGEDSARLRVYAARIASIFKALDAASFACLISFSPTLLYFTRQRMPDVVSCILYSHVEWSSLVTQARAAGKYVPGYLRLAVPVMDAVLTYVASNWMPEMLGCTLIGPQFSTVSPAVVAQCRARGLGVYIWVTNAAEEMAFYQYYGVSCGTDHVFPGTKQYGYAPDKYDEAKAAERRALGLNTPVESPVAAGTKASLEVVAETAAATTTAAADEGVAGSVEATPVLTAATPAVISQEWIKV